MRSMTEIEAIEQIKCRIATASKVVGNGLDGKAFEDLEMSIKALEKQIPKKVVNIQGNPTWGYCPSCNKTIDKSGSPNGCKHCLQRVDWGNEDDRD